jgi:hypothetical protein
MADGGVPVLSFTSVIFAFFHDKSLVRHTPKKNWNDYNFFNILILKKLLKIYDITIGFPIVLLYNSF